MGRHLRVEALRLRTDCILGRTPSSQAGFALAGSQQGHYRPLLHQVPPKCSKVRCMAGPLEAVPASPGA